MLRCVFVWLVCAVPHLAWAEGLLAGEGVPNRRNLRLLVESDDPKVEVVRVAGSAVGSGYAGGAFVTVATTFFERLCRAPCGEVIDSSRSDRFILTGDGVSDTSPFDLADFREGVKMKVRAGSSALRGGGRLLAGLSVAGIVTGGSLLLVGALLSGVGNSSLSVGQQFVNTGLVTGGISLGVLIPAIIMMVAGSTKYELSPLALPPGGKPVGPNSV